MKHSEEPIIREPLSGSYLEGDVDFLLEQTDMAPTSLEERERSVASGMAHYSEMIGDEEPPTAARLNLFHQVFQDNAQMLARDIGTLASNLRKRSEKPTLVSIARAGTPIGVVLRRLLKQNVRGHYSISVIRDFGVDLAALREILRHHPAESIIFIDGWTGKGTIATELRQSLGRAGSEFRGIDPALWTPLDFSGWAGYSANRNDYILPSALLGGVISGLTSRSILPTEERGLEKMHRFRSLDHLREHDVSLWFADEVSRIAQEDAEAPLYQQDRTLQSTVSSFIDGLMEEFSLHTANQVKVGLGESTRASIRRIPEKLILGNERSASHQVLRELAEIRRIPFEFRPGIPVQSAAILR